MKLQNPKGKTWPEFYGQKSTSRIDIESSLSVKSLLTSGRLLTIDLNQLLASIIGHSTDIDKYLRVDDPISSLPQTEYFDKVTELMRKKSKTAISHLSDKDFRKTLLEAQDELRPLLRKDLKKKISENSDFIEEEISKYNLKNKIKLKIFDQSVLYYCKKCNSLIEKNEFKSKKCDCGQKITKVSDTEKQTAAQVNQEVEIFFKNNMWLEYGVELLFKQKNYQTQCGVYILGSSGVSHEIDIVAEREADYIRTIGECKNKEIQIDDIFKLSGKMQDTGCNYGFIFSTGVIQSNDVYRLAISRNIKIIEKVLEKTTKEMQDQIN